jgi:hypothetical protein
MASSSAATAKWVTPFTKGSMKSNTNEDWTYDHGVVQCVFGPCRLSGAFAWNGSDLTNGNIGDAAFDADTVHFVFSGQRKAFYSMTMAQKGDVITWTCTQICNGWRSVVHWTHDTKARSLTVDPKSGLDHPEGSSVNWTVLGEVPPPVAIVIAMMSRAMRLRELYDEYMSRGFKRCAILTLSPIEAWLCPACAEGDGAKNCACCKSASAGHVGTLCKQCAVKGKFRCARCNEPVGTSRVAALLCDTHGLGSRAKECCKMHYKELR